MESSPLLQANPYSARIDARSSASPNSASRRVDSPPSAQEGKGEAEESALEHARSRELTTAESRNVERLKRLDREVRTHELAHKMVLGHHATSPATFVYERGPDGRFYAVGGEVQLDAFRVPGDPAATVQKMQRIKRAALAPLNPSSQDRLAAITAAQLEDAARLELLEKRRSATNNDGSDTVFTPSVTVAEVFFGYSRAFPKVSTVNVVV